MMTSHFRRFAINAATSTVVLLGGCAFAPTDLTSYSRFAASPTSDRSSAALQFSPAVIEGDRLWVSGVVGVPHSARLNSPTDMEAAFVSAFDQVESILHRSGADWPDVMDVVTYHTDLGQQRSLFESVKQRYLKDSATAWHAVSREQLAHAGAIVEIKLIATLPKDRTR